MQSKKWLNYLCSFPRQAIQYHSNISYAPTSNAEEAEVEQFYDDLQHLLELTPRKDVLFIIGGWNAKVGSQEIPGITGKFGPGVQNETGQSLTVLQRECTGHHKHPLPTTQENVFWTSPDGQYRNQIDYILCSQRWKSSIQSAKRNTEADCGSGHKILIAKFRLKLKKVGKSTRPFRYDLNQIPYDCTVKVTNRFKGLDLIDRMPKELRTKVCGIVQEAVIKTISKKKKSKRQNGCLRGPCK